MSNKLVKHAFQRHPRPQLPTAAALLERSKKSGDHDVERKSAIAVPLLYEDPEGRMARLGTLMQRQQKWAINVQDDQVVMVKKIKEDSGLQVIEKLKLLHHPNVGRLKTAFLHESYVYLVQPYARFTLEDLLSVHIHLDEVQIQLVATSVCCPGALFTSYSTFLRYLPQ